MARIINTYRVLHPEDEEEPNKINIERKATKKLREIESLKKKDKHDLTDSEKEKLATENHWRNILHPPPKEPIKENLLDMQKRLKKEKEKQKKKEQKEQLKKEREKYEEEKREHERREKKRREEEREKREEDKRKWREEQRKKKEKEEEDRRQKEENERRFYPIEAEYKKLLKEYDGNTVKAYHKCSLRFHPDKNIGNEVIATENQIKLSEIHEKYSMLKKNKRL
jgi:hypothetical protein